MNNTPKVVISNTLTESPWENAVVAGGDLTETVNQLKAQPGGTSSPTAAARSYPT